MKNYTVGRKIIFVVFLVFSMDFLDQYSEDYFEMVGGYERRIIVLEEEVILIKEDLYFREESYRVSLQEVVKSLYEEEVYERGGYGIDTSSSISNLYEAIMNAATDFHILLESIDNYFDEREKYVDTIPSIWPVRFDDSVRITSGYGLRIGPISGEMQFHKGIDIVAADKATEIIATADGTVLEYWIFHGVYGKMVIIEHPSGFSTLYSHMFRALVRRKGDKVKRGDVIGWMGNTGKSVGKHLHYEVRKDGELVNPISYLSSNRILAMDK